MLLKLRLKLAFWLLPKKYRSVIYSSLEDTKVYAIENYADCMGETYSEFIEALLKIKTTREVSRF